MLEWGFFKRKCCCCCHALRE